MSHLPLWPHSPSSHEPFSRQSAEKASRLRGATVTEGVCPYCAVGLRPAHLHQGREAHRHRGQPRAARSTRGRSAPRGPNAFQLAVNPASRDPGALSRAVLRPLGDAHPRLGAGPDRPAHQGRRGTPTSPFGTSPAACSTRCARSAPSAARRSTTRRTTSSRSCSAADWEWSRSRTRPGYDIAPRCPVWAPRSAAARPPTISRISPTATASCSWARTWPRPIPVGFRWPMKAKEKGATLIHVDPRFTRMSALCDVHVGIRAGSDIAFLGGLVNYVLSHERWFKEYVLDYTNASMHRAGRVPGHRGPRRAVQRLPRGREDRHLRRARGPLALCLRRREGRRRRSWSGATPMYRMLRQALGMHGHSLDSGAGSHSGTRQEMTTAAEGEPHRDPTLQHPRCVFQILKRHFARYTPEMVSQVCGCAPEELVRVAELLCANSGRERTSAIVYALGWTQHTTGVQIIRTAGILQLLLGNMGRPGGGIMAMRGHSTIQGSTDLATLYDAAAGLPAAAVRRRAPRDPRLLCRARGAAHRILGQLPQVHRQPAQGLVRRRRHAGERLRLLLAPARGRRLLAAALLRSHVQGRGEGLLPLRAESRRGRAERAACTARDCATSTGWWCSTGSRSRAPCSGRTTRTAPPPADIKTEVFFIPAAAAPEKEGSLTNTQRLLQWHDKALDPLGDCRSDAWFLYNLGKRLKQLYAGSTDPQGPAAAAPHLGLRLRPAAATARRQPQPDRGRAGPREGAAGDQRVPAG